MATQNGGNDAVRHGRPPPVYALCAGTRTGAAGLGADPGWPGRAGDYATDYHARKRGTDSWRVAVRASSGVGPVTLRWEGPPGKLRRLQLRDETNGKTMAMRPGRSYTFQIRGGERLFAVIAR